MTTSAAPKGSDFVEYLGEVALRRYITFENRQVRTQHLHQKYLDSGVTGEEGLAMSTSRLACNQTTLHHPRTGQ